MRVKMKTVMCGPRGNIGIGQVADFDAKQAQDLINGGYAEAIDLPPVNRQLVIESVEIPMPETATAPNQKRRKQK